MKTALLIVDHGSVLETANSMLSEIAALTQQLAPTLIVKAAHMELAEPTIEQGILACIDEGATKIIVHPYMLSPGRHATKDIPRMVSEIQKKHPGVEFLVTPPLGISPKLAELILERAEILS